MSASEAYRDQSGSGHGYGHGGDENTEHNSYRPGAVRRAVAKVKNSTGLFHDPKASYVEYQDDKPHPHPKVEDVVNTIGYSLTQNIMQYLKGREGEEALETIFMTQSKVASRIAMTDEAKRATRVTAQEATTGSYDGAQRRSQELFANLPPSLFRAGSVVVGGYVVLMSVGVLFSLWRFALFGLQ